MQHHPDLIAAAQAEALRRYGMIIDPMCADAALRWVNRRSLQDPEHYAAEAALKVWRVECGVWPEKVRT